MRAFIIVAAVLFGLAIHISYNLGAAHSRKEAEARAEEKYKTRALEEERRAEEARTFAEMRRANPTVEAYLECGDLLGVDMQELTNTLLEDWAADQRDDQAREAEAVDPSDRF